MKLWLLRPIAGDALWEPWFDKAFGFIVRAETEGEARTFAQEEAGDEKSPWSADGKTIESAEPWTSAEHSTCVELITDGPAGVVMRDFAAA